METKVNAIVIRSVDFGDNDKILTLLTLEKGVLTAKIKGVKKAGAKLKFAAEPFCFAEYVLSEKSDKNLVINASIIESFYSLREDIKKFYAGNVILEYVKKFSLEGIIAKEFFMLVITKLKETAYESDDPEITLIEFLLKALSVSGYGLDFSSCAECGKKIEGRVYFDYEMGGFLCENCVTASAVEVFFSTYRTLYAIENKKDFEKKNEYVKNALKLLDFYILNKTGEKIKALKEIIDI